MSSNFASLRQFCRYPQPSLPHQSAYERHTSIVSTYFEFYGLHRKVAASMSFPSSCPNRTPNTYSSSIPRFRGQSRLQNYMYHKHTYDVRSRTPPTPNQPTITRKLQSKPNSFCTINVLSSHSYGEFGIPSNVYSPNH